MSKRSERSGSSLPDDFHMNFLVGKVKIQSIQLDLETRFVLQFIFLLFEFDEVIDFCADVCALISHSFVFICLNYNSEKGQPNG